MRLTLLLILTLPLAAHHSVAAEYDTSRPITLSGTVTNVEWMNPHAYVSLEVKGEGGVLTTWKIETASPNALSQRGWTKDTVKTGDHVTITALPAKDGKTQASATAFTLADGKKLDPLDHVFALGAVH